MLRPDRVVLTECIFECTYMQMDPSENREMMARQAAGMVVVMVSVVVSRIKRSRHESDPLLYELNTDAE